MKSRNSYLILGVLVIALLLPNSAFAAWRTGCVDCPRYFTGMESRALALDSSGNPHIVYGGRGGISDGIHYAYYDGVSWHIETVDNRGSTSYPSIAIDSSDKVYISYGSISGLIYTTNASGSWVTEIADTDRALFSSIAIDSSGKVHISYYGLGGLKYATNAPGLWVTEIVDSNGMFSSIAVDSSDNVYISYSYDNYLKLAANASGPWVIEVVDDSGWVTDNTSIAIDSSDRVHISYGDSSGYPNYLFNLKYATNASGSWVIEIVDSNGWVGENTSIAIDSSGGVHISYGDYTNYPNFYPKYATNASGSWVTEIVDDSGVLQNISKTSIAVDSSDNVHISYVYERYFPSSASPKFYLKYSSNSSGSWVTETVDSGGKAGRYASVAIDSTDKVHISYVTDQGLMHKTNASGSWVAEIVDGGGSWSNSIATDSRDNVHISYSYCYSYNRNCELKYATNTSGSWVTEIVDDDECFSSNSIAVDSSDKVHIRYLSYYEDKAYPNYYLKYATNASGSWVTETVLVGAAREDSGNSIAIDSAGKVHIAYRDAYWSDFFPSPVNHVTNASGSWVTEIVDSRGGLSPSIAIDSTDKVHISYYYPIYYTNFRDLKYTTNTSGSWVTEIVDNGEGLISDPSIAIDSTDNVHISYAYYDYPYSNLKYATNASGSWVTETVDSDAGEVISMAMDSTDKVYIVYYDRFHYDLKYATNKPLPDISVTDSVDPADDLFIPFGEVRGGRHLGQTVTVTNIAGTGSEKLVISTVYLTGANPEQFDIRNDDCSNTALSSSESCTIQVVFTPEEAGVYSARLGIDSNDFDTPELYVELTGTSVTKRKQGRNSR